MAVTAPNVATWAKFPAPTGEELALLDKVVAAVTGYIIETYSVNDPMTDHEEIAVMMQASRLWHRRDSANGIISFDEFGAVRVSRMDPDVDAMLTPKFGFA